MEYYSTALWHLQKEVQLSALAQVRKLCSIFPIQICVPEICIFWRGKGESCLFLFLFSRTAWSCLLVYYAQFNSAFQFVFGEVLFMRDFCFIGLSWRGSRMSAGMVCYGQLLLLTERTRSSHQVFFESHPGTQSFVSTTTLQIIIVSLVILGHCYHRIVKCGGWNDGMSIWFNFPPVCSFSLSSFPILFLFLFRLITLYSFLFTSLPLLSAHVVSSMITLVYCYYPGWSKLCLRVHVTWARTHRHRGTGQCPELLP